LHGGLINFDKLILDTEIETTASGNYFIYEWNVYNWQNGSFVRVKDVIDNTGNIIIFVVTSHKTCE
jgi:hypothetical protein